jgi:hypothetical protein
MTTLMFHLRGLYALLLFLYGFCSPLVLGTAAIALFGMIITIV